jgi:hypothetical protein
MKNNLKIRHVKRFSKKQNSYAALLKLYTLPFTQHRDVSHDEILRDKGIINELADDKNIHIVKSWSTGITKVYLRNVDDVAVFFLIAENAIRVAYIFE